MARSWIRVLTMAVAVFSLSAAAAQAEGRPLVGVDLGVVQPVDTFDDYAKQGGVFSPFAGYMFNEHLGVMGQVQVLGTPNQDRPGVRDDDATWILGGAAGPRIAVPFGDGELYGTAQGGLFTGLAPNSVAGTDFGFSVGAGINGPVTDDALLGVWVRFSRFYEEMHGEGDVEWVSAGVGFTFDLAPTAIAPPSPSPPSPAPARVVKAVPPPPPPPPPLAPARKRIVLRGVNFDFDDDEIRTNARPVLDEAISVLREEGKTAVVAVGHTDSRGNEEYNQKLSVRRAAAVRAYLVEGGIDAARVEVEGWGETRPVASNDTEDGRAQNRRVELQVVGY